MEPNAPLADFSPLVEDGPLEDPIDVKAETDAKRRESEQRLLSKKQQLRRFHDQICLRISEKQQQSRVEAQQQEKLLDDKFIKVLEATKPKEKRWSVSSVRAANIEALAKQKSDSLKVLRLDAQTRQLMLASVSLSPENHHHSVSKQDPASASAPDSWSLKNDPDDDEERKPRNSAHELLPKQRVALYATVRRRYMERERADVHRINSNTQTPVANSTIPAQKDHAKSRQPQKSQQPRVVPTTTTARARETVNEPRCQSGCDVKVVDMTLGCEVRLHKQVASSSTPWRKKSGPSSSSSSSSARKGGNQTHERFLSALAIELRTPALCSCARNMASSPFYERPCANNCALYNDPKQREKLLTSVYKQQQQQQQISGSRKGGIVASFSSPAC